MTIQNWLRIWSGTAPGHSPKNSYFWLIIFVGLYIYTSVKSFYFIIFIMNTRPMLYILLCWMSNIIYILCVILCSVFIICYFEQVSNVRIPWHLHNENFFNIINNVYITVRSHRLLGPSTTTYLITIVLLNNLRDIIRLLYKKVHNSQFVTVETTFNCMYVEHIMVHSAKPFYSNCHLHNYHKSKSIFLMITSNTLQTWQKN